MMTCGVLASEASKNYVISANLRGSQKSVRRFASRELAWTALREAHRLGLGTEAEWQDSSGMWVAAVFSTGYFN